MELELQQQELLHFEPILSTTLVREETMEMIVPDALPDILAVLDTCGTVLLGRKETSAGCVNVTGTVRCGILYRPEGSSTLQTMTAELPFQVSADVEAITANSGCTATVRIALAETRVLNPRKVLVRAEIIADLTVYSRKSLSWCCDIPGREEQGVQQRLADCSGSFARQVTERPFHFSDTLNLPGSKPPVETILRSSISISSTEEKIIGNKLIFKGSAAIQLLYLSAEDEILSASFDLPFSQMIDEEETGDDVAYQLMLSLQSCEIIPDDGEGRHLSLELDILAQAVLWETRTLSMVSDAYSVRCMATPELTSYVIPRLLSSSERRYSLRELMDAPSEAREVLSASLLPGQLRISHRENLLEVSGEVRVSIVCEDAHGDSVSVTQTFPIALEIDADRNCAVNVAFLRDETAAIVTAGGLEIRSDLVFQIMLTARETVQGLSGLQMDSDSEIDYTGKPSIVLRQLHDGETLWDIAKAYCTTSAEIERANELQDSEAVSGRMLLIPRKR